MQDPIKEFEAWLAEMDDKLPAVWDMLPDIGLYMDQVQTYIDKQLTLYRRDEKDRLLTSAMINNYIKDDMIPRAISKKYSPTHLALLIMIGTLKQVLSMQNLNRLLSSCREPDDAAALYSLFLEIQKASLNDSQQQAKKELNDLRQEQPHVDDAQAMRNLALKLSIEARTRILIAEKILAALAQEQDDTGKHKQSKKNNKNSKED